MNLGGKQDLDALLRSWPAPPPAGVASGPEGDGGWEDRADAIVRAATAARGAPDDAVEALFAPPALAAEPGEPATAAGEKTGAGEKKMSEEKDPAESPASVAPPPTERKRQSLKEIAARASQGGARLSQPGAAPMSTRAAPTATPLPKPVEAGKDDSGVINLAVVQKAATPQQIAAAEKAKPAQAGLFEDDKPKDAAASPAASAAAEAPKPAAAANVVAIQPKRSNMGAVGGVAIALIGIAAAAAITMRKPPAPPPVAANPAADKPAVVAVTPTAAPAPTAAPTAAPEAAPTAEPDKAGDAKVAAVGSGAPAASAASGAASGVAVAAKGPSVPGKPGDLNAAMEKAVGKDGNAPKAEAVAIAAEPAQARSQNIPEQPSQGAVAAAVGPVMGAAKACVAGADDVSRAQVTFSSSGSVTSVSVSGWAAAHGKSGCVQAAFKAAKTNPFSKPSFTVGVPIRP